jgi:predicted dehydrogenase
MSLTRRTFIQSAGALAASAAVAPLAKGKTGSASPRASAANTVNIGVIGLQNMGWNDMAAMLYDKNVRVVALCDVDKNVLDRRAKDLLVRQERRKLPQRPADLLCSDYRRVLERKDVDAVLIGTPDHWHCLQFVDACKAGKDIYVQKPFANSIAECDVMVEAAKKHKRVAQVGLQQRGGKYWRDLRALIRSGWLGKIHSVHVWANFGYVVLPTPLPDAPAPAGVDYDLWLGPAPERPFNPHRFHGSWRNYWNYGGGLVTDWGVHLLDIVLWNMDIKTLPIRTMAHGGKFLSPNGAHETHDTLAVTYQHKDFVMTWENDASNATTAGHVYGIRFRGEKGYIVANRSGWKAYSYGDKVLKTSVDGDGWENAPSLLVHAADFLKAVRGRDTATACTPEEGALCAKYAHLGNIAARVGGGALVYDEATRTFDNPAANPFIKPAYRAPWKFPEA